MTSATSSTHTTSLVNNHMEPLQDIWNTVNFHKDLSQVGIKDIPSSNSFPQQVQQRGIIQCDGADTVSEVSEIESIESYDSEDEADSNPVRDILVQAPAQGPAGAPLRLEVDVTGEVQQPSCVPLCAVSNPRSGWNKLNSIRTFLKQVGPDVLILSEHWGRKRPFEEALALEHYKVSESSRGIRGIPTKGKNGKPTKSTTGGGVAVIYCQENLFVEEAEVEAPEGVEATWIVLTPKRNELESVKKILVGGIYIAPCSRYKQ